MGSYAWLDFSFIDYSSEDDDDEVEGQENEEDSSDTGFEEVLEYVLERRLSPR